MSMLVSLWFASAHYRIETIISVNADSTIIPSAVRMNTNGNPSTDFGRRPKSILRLNVRINEIRPRMKIQSKTMDVR